MARSRPTPWRGLALLALALAVFLAASATLYPGWYSYDSAWQLFQARTKAFSNIQPPGLPLAWSALLDLGLPPGALLVAHLALLAAGLALAGLAMGRPHAFLLPLLLLWPPFLVLAGHLWVDVGMTAALALATGWIAWARSAGRTRTAWLALLPLAFAVGVRHNAVFAVLPLVFLLLLGARGQARAVAGRALAALVLTAGLFGAWIALANRVVTIPMPAWTPVAIWDLSAASVADGEMLLPAGMRGPGLTVAELRPLVNPDTSMTILVGAKSGVNPGIDAPLPPAVSRELLLAWLGLPATHPGAWLAHRAAVGWSLLGPQREAKTETLFIVPQMTRYRDNPPLEGNRTQANARLVAIARDMKATAWCAPISYLGLAAVAALLALRRGFRGDRALVLALAGGAWLSALPLVVLVPAAEWRYLLWPMLSAVVAFLLALDAAPRRPLFGR